MFTAYAGSEFRRWLVPSSPPNFDPEDEIWKFPFLPCALLTGTNSSSLDSESPIGEKISMNERSSLLALRYELVDMYRITIYLDRSRGYGLINTVAPNRRVYLLGASRCVGLRNWQVARRVIAFSVRHIVGRFRSGQKSSLWVLGSTGGLDRRKS